MSVPDDVREAMARAICAKQLYASAWANINAASRENYRRAADAALSALKAAGWAVVPKKSTPEMERAGANCFGGQGDSADARYEVSLMYRAMLTAAQEQKP